MCVCILFLRVKRRGAAAPWIIQALRAFRRPHPHALRLFASFFYLPFDTSRPFIAASMRCCRVDALLLRCCGTDYALLRKGVGRMIPVVMEPRCRNTRTWVGTVGGKLGGILYIDYADDGEEAQISFLNRRISWNKAGVTYEALLAKFWLNIDPYDGKGQFCDKGDHYTSAIFYMNDEQKRK